MKILLAASAVSLALAAGSASATTNLVKNGDFNLGPAHNTEFGQKFGPGHLLGGQLVPNWMGGPSSHQLQFFYNGGTQTTQNAFNVGNDPNAYFFNSFSTLSPHGGGNFVALDGDPGYKGIISQTINNLIVGQNYTLRFDWGAAQLRNRHGKITEKLQVTLGGNSFFTPVDSIVGNVGLTGGPGGFSGWSTISHVFTATAAHETLSFLSIGTPAGLPPVAVLDSISLTGRVPEPASWALMLVGFGGLGAVLRRRRSVAALAA